MPDVTYPRTMITGMPGAAAPAEIDNTAGRQFRAVLPDSAVRGLITIVADVDRPGPLPPRLALPAARGH